MSDLETMARAPIECNPAASDAPAVAGSQVGTRLRASRSTASIVRRGSRAAWRTAATSGVGLFRSSSPSLVPQVVDSARPAASLLPLAACRRPAFRGTGLVAGRGAPPVPALAPARAARARPLTLLPLSPARKQSSGSMSGRSSSASALEHARIGRTGAPVRCGPCPQRRGAAPARRPPSYSPAVHREKPGLLSEREGWTGPVFRDDAGALLASVAFTRTP